MTWGFVASFGGVLLVMCLLWIWEQILIARSRAHRLRTSDTSSALTHALAQAEEATQQAGRTIAAARSIAARS